MMSEEFKMHYMKGEPTFEEKDAAVKKFIYDKAEGENLDKSKADYMYKYASDNPFSIDAIYRILSDEHQSERIHFWAIGDIIMHSND